LVVGGHNVFRQSLAVAVGQEPDLEVVEQAGLLAEARQVWRTCDVAVVMDLLMPDGDGAQFVWELRSQSTPRRCSVLVLTESLAAGEDHVRARTAGADEVLSKAASLQGIIDALKRV
jgi:two-component system, NarL family, response regulator DevR